jgi:hypothetical protein
MKLSNILLEGLVLYKIDILIKTSTEENQVFVYNEIRGLQNIVVVTVEQNDYLKSKATDKFQYALLKTKYLASGDPKEAINNIKKDALITNKVQGLLQFIPRYQTIQKVGQY